MSKLTSFFKENAKQIENKKVKIDRFSEEFEVRGLNASQTEKIMDRSIKTKPGVNGKLVEYTSQGKYLRLMAIEIIVYPDLDDAELQESYGVKGAENLLDVLLTQEEVIQLVNAVDTSASINEEIEESKN
jgi:hypothetical protein